jgi:hypothetical protein
MYLLYFYAHNLLSNPPKNRMQKERMVIQLWLPYIPYSTIWNFFSQNNIAFESQNTREQWVF